PEVGQDLRERRLLGLGDAVLGGGHLPGRVGGRQGVVTDIAVEVGVAGEEAQRVLADEPPQARAEEAGPVIEQEIGRASLRERSADVCSSDLRKWARTCVNEAFLDWVTLYSEAATFPVGSVEDKGLLLT